MKCMVMRDHTLALTDSEKLVATKALTEGVRGIDDQNHKSWSRFIRNLFGLEAGEIAQISTEIPRSGPFHRFHMAMESAVFDAQERFTEMEQFRNWIKIGAGHVIWVPGAKGGIVPLPKSISYAKLEEQDMRKFHSDLLVFFRGPHAAPFLWKHLSKDAAAEMMDTILARF